MPTKTPDSTSMSHRHVPLMGILKAMAKVNWKYQTEKLDGKQVAQSPILTGYKGLQSRR